MDFQITIKCKVNCHIGKGSSPVLINLLTEKLQLLGKGPTIILNYHTEFACGLIQPQPEIQT